jgi:hypothetical protein
VPDDRQPAVVALLGSSGLLVGERDVSLDAGLGEVVGTAPRR